MTSTWILVVFLSYTGKSNTYTMHSLPDWKSQTECRQAGEVITHKKKDTAFVCIEQKKLHSKVQA